jgi:protein-tyrosine phosphatase
MSQKTDNNTISTPVPFSRSYWVVPGKLLAGYYPGDLDTSTIEKKLKGILRAGIRYVINLMEENEHNWDGKHFRSYEDDIKRYAGQAGVEITLVRRPIKDLSAPTHEFMRNILDEIDHAVSQNKPVYVHCWGGKGRTGTVVGCYLARHGYAQGEYVLNLIHELRKNDPEGYHPSPETRQQRDMVTNWQEGGQQ